VGQEVIGRVSFLGGSPTSSMTLGPLDLEVTVKNSSQHFSLLVLLMLISFQGMWGEGGGLQPIGGG
jgi:hypothetical protein